MVTWTTGILVAFGVELWTYFEGRADQFADVLDTKDPVKSANEWGVFLKKGWGPQTSEGRPESLLP